MAGEIDQIARRRENVFGAAGDFEADVGEHDIARTPFDQFGADLAFEFAHLHRQRWLGHRALLRGATEMTVTRERTQVTQLTQGDHLAFRGDKVN